MLLPQFEHLHERAIQATALRDFGPGDYIAPMKRLLADYDAHASFTAIGQQMIEAQLVGALITRLIAQQGFTLHPELLHTPIARPIVIVGMMRSGSTALLRLLAQDPDVQWLPPWLASAPMPRPPRESWAANPWFRHSAAVFEQLNRLSANFERMHPMAADEPDECRLAIDHTFWSPGLATMATAPEYAQWCLECDASFAYRRYRQVLGLISGGNTQRWVLKDPCHLWGLDALLNVFPDACVVWTAPRSGAGDHWQCRHHSRGAPAHGHTDARGTWARTARSLGSCRREGGAGAATYTVKTAFSMFI